MKQEIKNKGIEWTKKLLNKNITYTELGSISYLLYGKKPSEQSINIKFGYFGEFLTKELIKDNENFELLNCGIQLIQDNNKDIDLIFKDKINNIIYYRELKGNIKLDTEKLEATHNKCLTIKNHLIKEFKDHNINYGILNWSIYNRNNLKSEFATIRKFEKNNLKIDHFEDFLKILNINWNEREFYDYFKYLGDLIIKNN